MLTVSRLKHLYLAYFSKPAGDRPIYRAMQGHTVRRILEIGIGTPARAVRMIELAQRRARGETIRYAAIDLFEARGDGEPALPLKEAHRLLKATSAQVQLIPGDPVSALARSANSLQNTDLIVISGDYDDAALAGAWFYLPRMLHERSVVFRESGTAGEPKLPRQIPLEDIAARANATRRRRAA